MSASGHAVGTILFQEGIITVQNIAKYDASSKLPLLWNPLQYNSRPKSGIEEDRRLIQGSKSSASTALPNIHASVQSRNAVGTDLLSDDIPQFNIIPSAPRKPRRQSKEISSADAKKRPVRHMRLSMISDQTLAEITQAKSLVGGAVVCRYDEHDMQRALIQSAERANHRREVIQNESAAQRARARKKRKLKRRKQLEKKQSAEDEDFDTVELDQFPNSNANSRRPSPLPPSPERNSRRPSMSPRSPCVSVVAVDNSAPVLNSAAGSDTLQKIKLKSPKALRMNMLSKNRDRMKAEMQVRIRREERQKEFQVLPLSEQEALERAYEFGNDKARGSINSHTEAKNVQLLSHYHPAAKVAVHQSNRLYKCLRELGMDGKKELEKKEIKLLCHEAQSSGEVDFYGFCFDLVPAVRSKLLELNHESLAEQFAYYDNDKNGFLDKDECSHMLTKLCRNMDRVGFEGVRQEFETVFDRVKIVDTELEAVDSEYVDFEGFQILNERVREKNECILRERVRKIVEAHRLSSAETNNYAEELLVLHDTFVQAARGAPTYLDGPELFGALLEQGLMPYDAADRMQVESMVEGALQESSTPGCVSFREFLHLIRSLREVSRLNAHPHLLAYFQDCDKDGNGKLSYAEASVIFSKLGMVPQCREDQDEMKNMLLKVDVDHSGDLDFPEFTHLVQHITEKLRANERRRTNGIAQQLGFNEHQVAELREVFFNLDSQGNGDIGIEECRKILTLLHLDMPADDLKSLFVSVDKARKGRLDLSNFFGFMEAISKTEPKAFDQAQGFSNILV